MTIRTPHQQAARSLVDRLRRTALAALLVAGGLGTAAAQQPAPASAPAPVREAKAIEALAAMGKYLRSLKSYAVHADTAIDEILENGQKLQFAGAVDYRVQMPNRLRAEVRTDRKTRDVVYDGKTITQFAPRMGYYASIAAPGTIAETLAMVDQKYDVEIPLADLFFWGTDKSGVDDIKAAAYIGPAKIGGKSCDHYAYRQEGVDWQVWIETGKQPLPCKMVITTTSEAAQPQYSAVLKWDLAPKFGADTFKFAPPKGARQIDLAPVAAAK
jgi:hypothetical protein